MADPDDDAQAAERRLGTRVVLGTLVLMLAIAAVPVVMVFTVDRKEAPPLLPPPAPPPGPLLDTDALAAEIEAALEQRDAVAAVTVTCAPVARQAGLVSPCTAFDVDPLTSTPRVRRIRVTQGRRGATEWQVLD